MILETSLFSILYLKSRDEIWGDCLGIGRLKSDKTRKFTFNGILEFALRH